MRKLPLIAMMALLFLSPALAAERIVFLGDSLTAGYGLEPQQAYPALVEQLLDERGRTVQVVNAGVSGDTTAGGLRRADWVLRQPVDVLVIALGANDALRGQPVEAARDNLRGIISKARAAHPRVRIILAGMLAPPNMGSAYQQAFRAIFPELAEAEAVELLPFLLEGVAGEPDLNLADGIHPNAEGQRRIARQVAEIIASEPAP
jgi:acyl-CoA thioesterase-1